MKEIVNKMMLFGSSGGERKIIRRVPKEFVPTGVPYLTANQLIVWKEKKHEYWKYIKSDKIKRYDILKYTSISYRYDLLPCIWGYLSIWGCGRELQYSIFFLISCIPFDISTSITILNIIWTLDGMEWVAEDQHSTKNNYESKNK